MDSLISIIEEAFEQRQHPELKESRQTQLAVRETINLLDSGELRVAELKKNGWIVNEWVKKAVLLSFIFSENRLIEGGSTRFFDKVPGKFEGYTEADFSASGVRVVPPAMVRQGVYIGPNAILMPSYVNIGARIGENTMIDTWATVGSCAQIGSNVHLSGGAGIGGVLEPIQASPTIIEDNCFVGARSEIVEGVIVGKGSVISMGVYIGQSTKILDRESGEITYGAVPAGSVVVSGSIPSTDHSHSLYCAVIVKRVDDKTRKKIGINEILRDI